MSMHWKLKQMDMKLISHKLSAKKIKELTDSIVRKWDTKKPVESGIISIQHIRLGK
jgi:hypothetical protein